jgi:signal transduction histidine kinase/ActR/RegA family two-component response regulator
MLGAGLLASVLLFVALRFWLSARGALAMAEESNQRLHAANEAVETATRAKSTFLANMSHEIRTPMTAVLGFAENLLDPQLAESDRSEAIQAIRRNADHLLGVINDILDVSKIEANRLDIESVECSPCAILGEVASMMRTRAKGKGLQFALEYVGPMPSVVRTDPTRLRQILVNLVGNAIKFTETGGVRLVARCIPEHYSPEGGNAGTIQLDVIDTGIGMTAEEIGRLFQPFSQADASVTRRFGGTGLGLTISRKLCELLHGSISIESQAGRGSLFRVIIPVGSLDGVPMIQWPDELAVAGPAPSTPASKQLLTKTRVLLAEDGPDNQRLLAFVLRKAGADVSLADNGQIAIETALAARDRGEPFSVVLMDMQMPVMDGYTAVGLLRRRGYKGPIVALTANAMSGDREKCLNIGCDDYLTKPVQREKLVQSVSNLISSSTGAPTTVS